MRPRSNAAKFTAAGQAGRLPDDAIVRLYADLGSSEAVAVRARCSSQTVRDILRQNGVPIAGRGGHKQSYDLTVAEMAERYTAGMSLWQISRRAGCAPSTVRNRLRECGILLRPNSWANSTRRSHDNPPDDEPD